MKAALAFLVGYLSLPSALWVAQQIARRDFSMITPALTWGYTALLLAASKHTTLLGLVAGPQLISTILFGRYTAAYTLKYLHLPAAFSLIAYALSLRVAPVPSLAALSVFGLHMHSIVIGLIRFMILPAPFVAVISDVDKVRESLFRARYMPRPVSIPSGSYFLDAALWLNESSNTPNRWVIYLGGNGEMYEHSFEFTVRIAMEVGAHALMHNVRGVARSGGTTLSARDMEEDAANAIRYILNHYPKTTEKDILLFGHSIGGSIAANVVANKFPDCSIVLDRTFSSLSEVAAVVIHLTEYPRLVHWAVNHAFGEMDTVSALKKIPHKRMVCSFHRSDQIISFSHASLGRLYEGHPWVVELTGSSVDPHNTPTNYFRGHGEIVKRMKDFFSSA